MHKESSEPLNSKPSSLVAEKPTMHYTLRHIHKPPECKGLLEPKSGILPGSYDIDVYNFQRTEQRCSSNLYSIFYTDVLFDTEVVIAAQPTTFI